MPFQAVVVVLCLAISNSLLLSASSSFASKHTKKTKPNSADTHHRIGWRFTLPKGDPAKGRAVFEKFECHYCHEVHGENFPSPTENAPELSQISGLHPVEFFAESIMNPNAVVPKSYREPDGKSPMTYFAEKMTVQELIDVSAYVASLRPKGGPKAVSAPSLLKSIKPGNTVQFTVDTDKRVITNNAKTQDKKR